MKDIKVGNLIKVEEPFGSDTMVITEILSSANDRIRFKCWSSGNDKLSIGVWSNRSPNRLLINGFVCRLTLLS